MKRKDIILLTVVIVLAIGFVALFLYLTQKQENFSTANITTNTSKQNNINDQTNINEETNENINAANTNTPVEEITFENFFKVVYLAKFTGSSNPPVTGEFSQDDKIVMSVRVKEGLKTELKMQAKIYKDDRLISDTGEINILDGEVGLQNPGKKGDYELRLFINDTLVKTITFKIS